MSNSAFVLLLLHPKRCPTVYSGCTCRQNNSYSYWTNVWWSAGSTELLMSEQKWKPVDDALSHGAQPPPPCRAGSLWALSSAESPRNRLGWAWFCQHSSGFRKTLSDKQEPTMSHAPNFTMSDPKCIWQLSFESKYTKYVQSAWKEWPARAEGFYRSQTDSRVCTTFEMEEHMKQMEGNNRKEDFERHWEKPDSGGARAPWSVRPS